MMSGDAVSTLRRCFYSRAMGISGLLLFLGIFIGCDSSPNEPNAPSSARSVNRLPATGDSNLDYWLALNQQIEVLRKLVPAIVDVGEAENTKAKIMIGFAIDELMQTPTEKVDAELVAWSIEIVEAWQMRASVASFLADVARSGKSSDPKYKSWLAYKIIDKWLEADEKIQLEGIRLQQTLSARYGKQFPPCSY